MYRRSHRLSVVAASFLATALWSGCASSGSSPAIDPEPVADGTAAAEPRVVQPGAPGQPTRTWEGGGLDEVEGASWTEADVAFMQGMIHHHAQALEMTALIEERTESRAIRQMGLRMQISQGDEIALMSRWLGDRGREVPDWRHLSTLPSMGGDHAGMEHHGTLHEMPGMLSPAQMTALRAARDAEFDRLFLEYMIQHHEGAVVMVRELFSVPGAGQESQVFHFASEVEADQTIEIRRMRQLLGSLR